MLQRRNDLKAEIDILTDRLCVLQDQLKEYSDISEEIKELGGKRALLSLEVLGLSQQVDIKKDRIKKEGQILSEIQSEINKWEIQIKDIEENKRRQQEHYEEYKQILNWNLEEIQNKIAEYERLSQEYKLKKEQVEYAYENSIQWVKYGNIRLEQDKQELEKSINLHNKTIGELENKIRELKKYHEEVDNDYQKLLEKYITL